VKLRDGRLTTLADGPSYRRDVSLPQPDDVSPTRSDLDTRRTADESAAQRIDGAVSTVGPIESQSIRNPKPNESGAAAIYRYYAGFSSGFVGDVLASLRLKEGATILDPWNGGGTTTDGAARHGFDSVGIDINPAAVVIARARLATAADVAAAKRTMRRALELVGADRPRVRAGDLLCRWFGPKTASEIRRIERTLADVQGRSALPAERCADMPAANALLYVALFHALRALLREARTTNPTWFRLDPPTRRVGARAGHALALFEACATDLLAAAEAHATSDAPPATDLRVASSVSLPLEDRSVDAIVTSPPYCTRIDYAIATLPELALLGFDESEVRQLRDSMIGTPTVSGKVSDPLPEWGATCIDTLRRIGAHPSKDSKVYYHKVQWAYFDRMAKSLKELDRVLIDGGVAVLVVQDSYYKDVHVDLRGILIEMAEHMGWVPWHERHFDASHAMSDIHPGIARYRTKMLPRETVIFLRKHHGKAPHHTRLDPDPPDRRAVEDR